MKNKKILLIPAIGMLVIFAIFAGCTTNYQTPSLIIIEPKNDAMLPEGNITIVVNVSNFNLIDKLGQTNVAGEGHIHYFLDVTAPTTPNKPAVTASGTYVATTATSYTWTNILSGQHDFSVELVNNDHTPLDPPVVKTVTVMVGEGKVYNLVDGWYQGQGIQYYDFGANTPLVDGNVLTAPIYVFVSGFTSDGSPNAVSGQHNVVDTIPGDSGYSDLWKVNFVNVSSDYQADSVRSVDDINQMGYIITESSTLVNCPIVPAGSTFETGISLVQGWYKNQKVFYPDFGSNPDYPAPIYVLITGFDGQGNPQTVAGQKNIIDVIPGDEGYSDFWRVTFVTVPQDYTANTFTSRADVLASGYPMNTTTTIVNCPVVTMPSSGGQTDVYLSAHNIAFNLSTITVPAGATVIVHFSNEDSGIPHNFAVYETSAATTEIFKGEIITGVSSTTYTFTAPSTPGTYWFRCDVHPTQMNGDFIVE